MDDIKKKLTEYIRTELASGNDKETIEAETSLAGVIDSTAIMELVVWIEGEVGFDVEIDDITPDNFGSIDKIAAYIERNRKS